MSFQENLRRYREAAGFSSARAFAEHIGVPYTTYISYENKNAEPKYDKLCQIAAALGVTTDELLDYSPGNISWIESRLKPALTKTRFAVDHIDENGDVVLSFMDDDSKIGPLVLSEKRLHAIFDEQEKVANQQRDTRLAELLDNALLTEQILG